MVKLKLMCVQSDEHIAKLTVQETMDFSAWVQGTELREGDVTSSLLHLRCHIFRYWALQLINNSCFAEVMVHALLSWVSIFSRALRVLGNPYVHTCSMAKLAGLHTTSQDVSALQHGRFQVNIQIKLHCL